MKKFILLILMCVPFSIYAEDIKYSNKYITDENYNITEEKLYKYYEEEKIYSNDYYLEGENIKEYPYKSSEYIIKEYESLENPEEKLNRTITSKNVDGYYSLKKINRILIRNVWTNHIILSEIEIYHKGEEIDYDYTCYDCKENSVINMNDKIYNSSDGSISFKSTIEINLDKEYDPAQLEVKVFFYSLEHTKFNFEVYYFDKDITKKFTYLSDSSNYDYIKFTKDVDTSTFNYLTKIGEYTFKLEKENIIREKWDNNLIITDEKLDENFYKKEENKTIYKVTDKYFKCYKVDKNYLKGYYLEMKEYIKDEKDYITRYKYIKKEQEENKEKQCSAENALIKNEKIKKEDKTNEKEQVSNIVINKTIKNKQIDKFRHIYIVIILLILFVMGYMLYNLGRE